MSVQFFLVCAEDAYLLKGVKTFFFIIDLFISERECVCVCLCVSLRSFYLPLTICFHSGKHKSAESQRRSFLCTQKNPNTITAFPKSHKTELPDSDKTGHHLPICHLVGISCLTHIFWKHRPE